MIKSTREGLQRTGLELHCELFGFMFRLRSKRNEDMSARIRENSGEIHETS